MENSQKLGVNLILTLCFWCQMFFYLKIIKGTLYRLLLWWQADGELSDLIQLVLYIHLCFRIKIFLLYDLCEMFFCGGNKNENFKIKIRYFPGVRLSEGKLSGLSSLARWGDALLDTKWDSNEKVGRSIFVFILMMIMILLSTLTMVLLASPENLQNSCFLCDTSSIFRHTTTVNSFQLLLFPFSIFSFRVSSTISAVTFSIQQMPIF